MEDFLTALFQAPISVILLVLGTVFVAASLIKIKKMGWFEIPDENRRRLGIIGVAMMAVAIVLAVLVPNSATPTSETTPGPGQQTEVTTGSTPYQDWEIIFVDNFNNNNSKWPVREINDDILSGKQVIENGVYHWDLTSKFTSASSAIYAFPRRSDAVSDFRAEVTVYIKERTASVRYGLIFRHTPEQISHYVFAIDDVDGTFGVSLYLNGSWSRLIEPKFSSAIKSNLANQLAVIGQGNHFYLYINGRLVDEFSDSQLSNGQAGLAMTVLPSGESAILEFDNFKLSTPIK